MSENSEEKDNVSQSFSFEDLKIAHRNNVMSKKFSFLKLKENYRSIVQPNAAIVEEVPKEIIVTAPTQAESTAENTFNAVTDEIQENPQTVFEKKSFVQRSKEKFYDIFVGQKTKAEIICDAILIFTILFASITSFVWFATPITEIGGVSYAGKTLNLYAFLFGDENSLFAQMKIAWESLSSLGNMTSEEMVGAVGVVMKFLRLIFLAVPTVVIGVKIIINLIMTPIHLSKKNFFGLRNTAVSSVACNLMVYVFFVFFGSISGGVGIDAYYIGYKVGTGMTVGVLISTVILIGTAITLFIDQRHSITQEVGTKWIKSLITGIGCVGIAIVLTFMRIYSIFMYVFSSSLSAALLSIMNGFEVKSLVFPVLNLFLFVACLVIYGRVNVGIRGSFSYLLNFNNNQIPLKQMAKKKKMDKRYAISFIPFIVLALLSVASVYVLSTPTFGYGWSVDIYAEFVAIFAIAAIGMSISIFFGKGKIKSKREKKG